MKKLVYGSPAVIISCGRGEFWGGLIGLSMWRVPAVQVGTRS
jgi:hypothetical protein